MVQLKRNKLKINLKNIALFVAIFFFVLSTTISFQYANEDVETIVIGYEPNYGIIDDINSIDHKGYGYELLLEMENYTDYNFEFLPYDFDEGISALENGDIDVFGPVSYTNERAEIFNYIETVFIKEQVILAAKKDRSIEYHYNDPSSIANKSISIYSDVTLNDYLIDYVEKNQIEVNYLESRDPDVYYYRDDADLYLVSSLNSTLDYQTVLNLGSTELYLITNGDNETLAKELNSALENVVNNTPNLTSQLNLKYYEDNDLNYRPLSKEESEALNSSTLKVGFYEENYPYHYLTEDNTPIGIEINLINYLSIKYGFEIEISAIEDVNRDDYDIILNQYNNDLTGYMTSSTYMNRTMMLISEEQELNGKMNIGYINSPGLSPSEINENYKDEMSIAFGSIDELMQAYTNNEISAMLVTDIEAYYLIRTYRLDEMVLNGTPITRSLKIYLNEDMDLELSKAINVMLNNLDNSVVEEFIAYETNNILNDVRIENLIADFRTEIIILILALISIMLIIAYVFQVHKKRQIIYLSNHDNLTNLLSVQYFRTRSLDMLKDAKSYDYELISCDIDNFRIINNIYGYEKGTEIIETFGKILKANYNGKKGIACRVVGDNFLILRKSENSELLKDIFEKQLIEEIKLIIGKGYKLTLSVGIYPIYDIKEPLNDLIDRANMARIEGKTSHKSTYIHFDRKMQIAFDKHNEIVYRMEDALLKREFYVLYQPKIDLRTLKVIGAEALVRWKTESNKLFFPGDFIPVFEANGFTVELDLYVFEEVCSFMKKNRNKYNIPLISVNLSAKTVEVEKIEERLEEIAKKYGIQANEIEIEVTESSLTSESELISLKVMLIKRAGFKISMDDFGAGQSSLNRLNSIDVDVIKLDKAFLENNIKEGKGNVILESVILMVKKLNMKVVCEGVETVEQMKVLQSFDCDIAQGYYFNKPLSENDFIKLLENK